MLCAVSWDRVDLEAAEIVVVIPVLGKTSFLTNQQDILDQLNSWHKTLGAGHVLVVTRLLEPDRQNVRLFVPHVKADLAASDDAAKQIYDYIATDTTGRAFFDTVDLQPGESLERKLHDAVCEGVFIAVRGDAYSSRTLAPAGRVRECL